MDGSNLVVNWMEGRWNNNKSKIQSGSAKDAESVGQNRHPSDG